MEQSDECRYNERTAHRLSYSHAGSHIGSHTASPALTLARRLSHWLSHGTHTSEGERSEGERNSKHQLWVYFCIFPTLAFLADCLQHCRSVSFNLIFGLLLTVCQRFLQGKGQPTGERERMWYKDAVRLKRAFGVHSSRPAYVSSRCQVNPAMSDTQAERAH